MATIRFTDEDRDDRGFVRVEPRNPEPRSLADLLPPMDAPDRPAPAARTMGQAESISLIVVALLAAGVLIWTWRGSGDAPAVAPHIPAVAAAPTGDAVLTPSPIPATAPAVAGRLLIAFAAPDGPPLGAIESTRAITPTAHYGADWIQADVAGSGRVWLRASDSPDLAIVGPDLAPPPTPRPPAATATPEPPRCETESDIRFTTERDVLINGVPRGHVIGRSCFSQADADAQANAQEQIVLQKGRTP